MTLLTGRGYDERDLHKSTLKCLVGTEFMVGIHAVRERCARKPDAFRADEGASVSALGRSKAVSYKHKLPASNNFRACVSHLRERLNGNKWLIWPGTGAWQETGSI